MEASLEKKDTRSNQPIYAFYGLQQFGINEDDITDFASYKRLLKSNYKQLAKKYHPDTSPRHAYNCDRFKILSKAYKKMSERTVIPITVKNINEVMELTKGYKSLDDVAWGPNFQE